MKPAFSVIFLTTLIGAGQGLFIAVFGGRVVLGLEDMMFQVSGAALALALLVAGLAASFFHLGRPERGWRAVACWRTSWLSREVIVLPLAMALVFAYAVACWWSGVPDGRSLVIGWLGVLAMLLLYLCTAMIYACIRFLQEWATPWTVINFLLMGLASGFLVATLLSVVLDTGASARFAQATLVLTVAALLGRLASLQRNRRIRHLSTVQSAIGIKHPRITQRSMGFTGGSFNTRAFFHHCSDRLLANLRVTMLVLAFLAPLALLALFLAGGNALWLALALALQYPGLVAERFLFFAQANHPQNIYYQTVG